MLRGLYEKELSLKPMLIRLTVHWFLFVIVTSKDDSFNYGNVKVTLTGVVCKKTQKLRLFGIIKSVIKCKK